MDESENLEYLNKLAVSIGVSYGNVYLVRMTYRCIYGCSSPVLFQIKIRISMNVTMTLLQGVYANLDIMQVISSPADCRILHPI